MKKFIGFLLCLALLLGNFSIVASAFSSEEATPASTPYAEAITPSEALNKLENAYENEAQSSNAEEERPIYEYASFYADVSHVQTSNDGYGIYPMQVRSIETYDYAIVRFCADTSVTLTSYQSVTVPYSDEEVVVPIGFTCTLPSNGDFISDYHAIETADILMLVDVYIGDEIVQTIEASIAVFATAQGAFASHHGKFYSYSAYIDDMLAKELIDQAMYKSAVKRMTRVPALSANESTATTQATLASSLQSLNSNTYRIYNAETGELETINTLASFAGDNGQPSTEDFTELPPTRIIITRSISYNSLTSEYTVSGTVHWSDILGNFHAANSICVKIMDEEVIGDRLLGNEVFTNYAGEYSSTIPSNEIGILENNPDIFIRLEMASDSFTVCDNVLLGPYKNVFYIETETQKDVSSEEDEDIIYNLNLTDFTDIIHRVHDSISIHQALVVGYHYFDAMEGKSQREDSELQGLKVHFPSKEEKSYAERGKGIFIEKLAYFNWDVILHELGHCVSYHLGNYHPFESEDKSHIMTHDLSVKQKENGRFLAWSEGWASYFGIAAQLYYQSTVQSIKEIPNAGDGVYTGNGINSETPRQFRWWNTSYDYETIRGWGECNEIAITAVLFDLMDTTPDEDGISWGHQKVWNYAKGTPTTSITTLSSFIRHLYQEHESEKSQWSKIGGILESQNIVPSCSEDLAFDLDKSIDSNCIQVTFESLASNVTDYGERNYKLYFCDHNYQPLEWDENVSQSYAIITPPENSSNSSSYFYFSESQWNNWIKNCEGSYFYYYVTMQNTSDGVTGTYYSRFYKVAVPTVTNSNIAQDETYKASKENWYIFNVEQGNHSFHLTGTSDMSIEIYKGMGNEAQKLIEGEVSAGEKYQCQHTFPNAARLYVKVENIDDSANTESSETFSLICTKTIQKGSNATAQCKGQDEVFLSFTAPKEGKYIFFSSSQKDTCAKLYSAFPFSTPSISDDDSGNFFIECSLEEDETVFVSVSVLNQGNTNQSNISVGVIPVVSLRAIHQGYTEELQPNGFVLVEFLSPEHDEYTFYTTGSLNTSIGVFSTLIDAYANTNRLDSSGTGATGNNAAIKRTVPALSAIYLRISANNSSATEEVGVSVTTATVVHALNAPLSDRVAMDAPIWYCFTAPTSGRYVFYTIGDSDTVGEIFSYPVPTNETQGALASNDEGGQGDTPFNFRIIYTMTAGQTVYIRVSEGVPFGNGLFTFYVKPY